VRRSFAKPDIAGRGPAIHDAKKMDLSVKLGGDMDQNTAPHRNATQ
jgi:hypothetical protein